MPKLPAISGLIYNYISIVMLLGIIFIAGCARQILEKTEVKENIPTKPTVCDFANNPGRYINKTIDIEGTLKFIGESYWSGKGEFFIESGDCKIQVTNWAPIEAINCPPTVRECTPPLTMEKYLETKLKLSGIIRELPKIIINNQSKTFVGTYFLITDVTNATIIS